jgi:hypothetical protein
LRGLGDGERNQGQGNEGSDHQANEGQALGVMLGDLRHTLPTGEIRRCFHVSRNVIPYAVRGRQSERGAARDRRCAEPDEEPKLRIVELVSVDRRVSARQAAPSLELARDAPLRSSLVRSQAAAE